MADEQQNSQSSQLGEEDLNQLKEAVSENNACSSYSSMQSGEVNACLSSTSKTRLSVQEKVPNCQFTNCTIDINTTK